MQCGGSKLCDVLSLHLIFLKLLQLMLEAPVILRTARSLKKKAKQAQGGCRGRRSEVQGPGLALHGRAYGKIQVLPIAGSGASHLRV